MSAKARRATAEGECWFDEGKNVIQQPTKALILAAGMSTRMKSARSKVLHKVCGKPILAYVLDACREAGIED